MYVFDMLREMFGYDVDITTDMRLGLEDFFIEEKQSINRWLDGDPINVLDLRFAVFINNPECTASFDDDDII